MGGLGQLSESLWAVLGCLGAPVGGLGLSCDPCGRSWKGITTKNGPDLSGIGAKGCLVTPVDGLGRGSGASVGGLGQLSGPLWAVLGGLVTPVDGLGRGSGRKVAQTRAGERSEGQGTIFQHDKLSGTLPKFI